MLRNAQSLFEWKSSQTQTVHNLQLDSGKGLIQKIYILNERDNLYLIIVLKSWLEKQWENRWQLTSGNQYHWVKIATLITWQMACWETSIFLSKNSVFFRKKFILNHLVLRFFKLLVLFDAACFTEHASKLMGGYCQAIQRILLIALITNPECSIGIDENALPTIV